MKKGLFRVAAGIIILVWSAAAPAHHSFAVHFVPDRLITIKGVVTEFRFTNPHGRIYLNVNGADGTLQEWMAETNSPNVLRRRGWSKQAIKAGDTVTIEGFPARDGTNYLRVHRVVLPDGRVLEGQGRVFINPQDKD